VRAGFAEIGGPQLAWIATRVPSVMDGWGPCVSPSGAPGHPAAAYGSYPPAASGVVVDEALTLQGNGELAVTAVDADNGDAISSFCVAATDRSPPPAAAPISAH
jgi:hypothetical protein